MLHMHSLNRATCFIEWFTVIFRCNRLFKHFQTLSLWLRKLILPINHIEYSGCIYIHKTTDVPIYYRMRLRIVALWFPPAWIGFAQFINSNISLLFVNNLCSQIAVYQAYWFVLIRMNWTNTIELHLLLFQ